MHIAAHSFAACSFCCMQHLPHRALLCTVVSVHSFVALLCADLLHTDRCTHLDAHRLAAQCFATLVHHCRTTATLVHHCHATAFYMTATPLPLWISAITRFGCTNGNSAILHLLCELTRTRSTLHYYTLFHSTGTLLKTAELLATLLPRYCLTNVALLLHTICTSICTTAPRLNLACT